LADSLPPHSDLPPSDLTLPPLARAWDASDEPERRLSGAGPFPGPPAAPPRDRIWLHALLFFATFLATTAVGADLYAGYVSDFGTRRPRLDTVSALVGGLWYSIPALLILGSHEMGHYVACRYYRINASLPYFIPAPLLSLFGTLGAVIRIRQPLRTRRILFDVGVAGPIAGFVVLVPAVVGGIAWSRIIRQPPMIGGGVELGEPVLFQLLSRWFLGEIPEGYILNAHPMAFAAIFGLLATALNLLPIGQLDGGHIAYANLGRRARWITLGTLLTMLTLGVLVAYSWLIWCLLMLILLRVTGWEHPPIPDDDEPLGRSRVLLTIAAVIIFALCFTPVPIQVMDLINTGGPPASQQSASAVRRTPARGFSRDGRRRSPRRHTIVMRARLDAPARRTRRSAIEGVQGHQPVAAAVPCRDHAGQPISHRCPATRTSSSRRRALTA